MDTRALFASKLAQQAFFEENNIPAPRRFPEGCEPYIVRPDRGAGGIGICSVDDYCEAGGAVNAGFLVQEELEGPVYLKTAEQTDGGVTLGPTRRLARGVRYARGAESVSDLNDVEEEALAAPVRRLAELLAPTERIEVKLLRHDGRFYVLSVDEG